MRSQEFSEEGFAAYFEYLHGSPLHKEGFRWVSNIFKAWRSTKKVLQECFRGSGKTTVLSRLFFSYWIGHFPHTTNGVIRVNGKKANETTKAVADIISGDYRFKQIFPHVVPVENSWGIESGFAVKRNDIPEEEWKDVIRQSSRPDGPTFIGYGYDSGSVQGMRVNGLLIIDDIHAKENTRSPRQLLDVKNFVKDQLLPIPVPNEGLEAWNFTPWVDNDAYAERKKTGLYIHSKSPVMVETTSEDSEGVLWPEQIEWPKHVMDSVESGEISFDLEMSFPFAGKYWKLNWPERWGIVEMALKYADIGQLSFAREYLLDLAATQGRVLKREWLHFMDVTKIDPSWPVVVGVDYASVSDKLKHRDRDYAAFAIGRAIPGGGLVLTGGYFGHYEKAESLKLLQRIKQNYPSLQTIKVEAIGKGEEFYNDAELLEDMSGYRLPLTKIESHGKASKGERFEDYLAPRFESSRIWVSDETLSDKPNQQNLEFIDEFVEEWLNFPNGRYDDVIDAVYMMAVAGEGFMPSKAQRAFGKKDNYNPFAHLNDPPKGIRIHA